MAVACAAAELLGRRALGLDLVFLIEGEEEVGSPGFADAVRKHKVTHLCLLDIFFCSSDPNLCARRISLALLTLSWSGACV